MVLGIKLSRSQQGQQITKDIRSMYDEAALIEFRMCMALLQQMRWSTTSLLTCALDTCQARGQSGSNRNSHRWKPGC
jgi:hypothetical protein